jgi:hypothetical protein
MDPEISEFSYGYALTETLIQGVKRRLRLAPIFPSLIEEGRTGGGYDVKIPFPGAPLFLQFKLSHRMVRASAIEERQGVLHTPFYRMHLRPTKHSQQHPMLLALEKSGADVYYAAPYFHTPAELNAAYASNDVRNQSIFIRPSEIGALPDQHEHHVAFKRRRPIYICSNQPREVRESAENLRFDKRLEEAFAGSKPLEPNTDSIASWADRLQQIVVDHRPYMSWISDQSLSAVSNRTPLQRFAYLAQMFFGCNVVLIAPAPEGDEPREA